MRRRGEERRDTTPEGIEARTAWVRDQSLKAGGWPPKEGAVVKVPLLRRLLARAA